MSWLTHVSLPQLISTYGYFALFAIVMFESSGIPLPGETALVTASIYAGTTHKLTITMVILAASLGAIMGDNLGYWVGRKFGFPLLLRIFDEKPLKLGQYMFQRYGGSIVFFGRFVAVLRAFAAVLAGVNRYSWPKFFAFNAAGGVTWASLFGLTAYFFGQEVHRVARPIGIIALAIAVGAAIVASLFFKRHQERLFAEAETSLPGPLEVN
jgi:membrane protein DedA with SNARE-associated domain